MTRTIKNNGSWWRGLSGSVASPFMAVCWNVILLFIVYSLTRLEFLLENYSLFSSAVSEGRLFSLLRAGTVFDPPGIFYTNALYILLMLLPLHFKERGAATGCNAYYRVCKWLFIIVNSLAVIANLVDSVYFAYTMRRTTADVAAEFGNEGNLVRIFFTEMLRHWYLLLFAIALIWGLWRAYVSPRIDIGRQKLWRYYAVSTVCLAIAAVTVVAGIRGGFLNHWYNYVAALPLGYLAYRLLRRKPRSRRVTIAGACSFAAAVALLVAAPVGGWRHRDIRPISLSNANAYTDHPAETALVLNTPFSIIRSIGKTVFENPGYFRPGGKGDALPLERIDSLYSPVHTTAMAAANPYAGKFAGKNVVVIIIESFGREYIGAFSRQVLGSGYQGYTPFTDELISRSLTFRHSFCNGRKSIDGMPSVLSSIPMFVKPFILTPQSLNKIEGLPGLLGRKGYDSAFFHGARTGSMGFDGYARSIGFRHYYGREDYDRDCPRGDKDFDGYWAIWDEPFLQYFARKMTSLKEPFVSAVFTASSHHPFRLPEQYRQTFKEGLVPIHKCIRYTDMALRRFFETAAKQPWYKNTLFIITSDHTNQSAYDAFKSDIGGFCSPVILFDPSGILPHEMRPGVAQQIDIMPTVLSLTGYDAPYLAFGKDMLATDADDSWAVNYYNGTYQYIRHGLVLQFDGHKRKGIYRLGDYLMKEELSRSLTPAQRRQADQMEAELKAIIQIYMTRMAANRLTL